ncbi:hypothetical protein Pint_36497 [Pistacia integerrima]|uniref:Uncharacterized protein n=1 Tax=Pistacia integerrima TaxID=434235 RepID=A0ACC0Y2L4_9ROSI|nr:hypothetical protein Pint_36497 [Pistacia integerrima]
MDLTQLTREKGWKQYTAISLMEIKLKEFSVRLECPKLKILLLGGEEQSLYYHYDKSKLLKVSDECLEEMKALEVASLRFADLSLKSLQFLTNLKTLELFGCNLRDISFLAKLNKLEILSFRYSRFDQLPIELSELKELRVLDLPGLIQLKNLEIEDAAELKQVFHGKEENEIAEEGKDIKLPNLKKLKLYKLEKLTRFFPENNHATLPALEEFWVIECPNLTIKEGVLDEFQNLQVIRMINCSSQLCDGVLFRLRSRGFQQLKYLQVTDNSELEEIFGDNDVIDEKEIQLPRLQYIILEDLPRLTNFCHVDYHFIFPAPPLDYLTVGRCPKISTRFSWDEENKSVHAEAKAPKIGNAEDESHEETSTDLICGRAGFKNLPQYIEVEKVYSNSHPTE